VVPAHVRALALPVARDPLPLATAPVPATAHPDEAGTRARVLGPERGRSDRRSRRRRDGDRRLVHRRRRSGGARLPATFDPGPAPFAALSPTVEPALVRALALPVAREPLPLAVAPIPAAAYPDEAGARARG